MYLFQNQQQIYKNHLMFFLILWIAESNVNVPKSKIIVFSNGRMIQRRYESIENIKSFCHVKNWKLSLITLKSIWQSKPQRQFRGTCLPKLRNLIIFRKTPSAFEACSAKCILALLKFPA